MADVTIDGIIYEELPNGKLRVKSYTGLPQGAVMIAPPDPKMAYEAPQANATLENTRLNAEKSRADLANAPYNTRKAAAEARAAEASAAKTEREAKTGDSDLRDRISRLNQLGAQINRVQDLYGEGVGQTTGLGGLLDYLPSNTNARFDAAGAALSQQGLAAFRVPGTGTVSDRDAMMFDRANLPTASTRDAAIEEQLRGLRSRIDQERQSLGVTPQQWAEPGDSRKVLATGADKQVRDPNKVAAASVLQRLLRSGAPDDEIMAAASALNASPGSISEVLTFRRKNPGFKGSYNLKDLEFSRENNSLLSQVAGSPLGSFVANAGDAVVPYGLIGGDEAREGLRDMRSANPNASLLGTVAGGIPAAAGLELGLARGGLGQLAASRAGDAIYGGLQGAGADGSALGAGAGALTGLLGGMAGRGVARGIGGAVGGVQDASVQALNQRDIPLTVGQAVGNSGIVGQTIRGVEDRLSGIPGLGSIINNRRQEGVQAFNRAAFNEGLAPINATTGGTIGAEGIDLARNARSQAYRDVLDPIALQTDPQFATDAAAVAQGVQRLPADMAGRGQYALDRAAENIDPNGALSGNGFQQMIRRFRRTGSENAPLPNGADLGDSMRGAEDAVVGVMQRQAPGAFEAFGQTNTVNRNVEVLRDAVNAARNGTRSHQTDVFMPSQLADAASRSSRRFGNTQGTTNQPFFDLTRAGQQVLPSSVPDSGTAGRLATLALPAALGGAGAGAGALTGDVSEGTQAGLGIGALLAAGGSRGAQQQLTRLLLERPEILRALGRQINERAAIGGYLGAPGGVAALNYAGQ